MGNEQGPETNLFENPIRRFEVEKPDNAQSMHYCHGHSKPPSTFPSGPLHSSWLSDPEFGEWARSSLPAEHIPPVFSENRQSVKNSIIQKQMKILDLEREFAEKVKALTHDIAREYVLLSPIRAIPDEILARILAEHLSCHYDKGATRSPAMAVCRRWRSVAISTPACWTRLSLSAESLISHSHFTESANHGDVFKALEKELKQFSLAGGLPLQLSLNVYGRAQQWLSQNGAVAVPLYEMLRSYVGRLGLYAETGLSYLASSLQASTEARLDRLTHLHLNTFVTVNEQSVWRLPRLRVLSVEHAPFTFSPVEIDAPKLKKFTLLCWVNPNPAPVENMGDDGLSAFFRFLDNHKTLERVNVPFDTTHRRPYCLHSGIRVVTFQDPQYGNHLIHGFQRNQEQGNRQESLENVLTLLDAFPSATCLVVHPTSFGNHDNDIGRKARSAGRILTLEVGGQIWMPESLTRLTAFENITRLHIGVSKSSPDLEWDPFKRGSHEAIYHGQTAPPLDTLLKLLQETDGQVWKHWKYLKDLVILHASIDATAHIGRLRVNVSLLHLLAAIRSRHDNHRDTTPPCLLTMRNCYTLEQGKKGITKRSVPHTDRLDWPGVESVFKHIKIPDPPQNEAPGQQQQLHEGVWGPMNLALDLNAENVEDNHFAAHLFMDEIWMMDAAIGQAIENGN